MSKKTVIIGGVAGGATTAARLRRRDEEREIILLEKGEYISYANCGLPYYIGGVIQERQLLLLQNPKLMKERFRIDVRTSNEVIKIHPENKSVTVKDYKTGEEYEESYDDLVIATGSSPLVPPIPGIDGPNIHTLWTIPDTDMIKQFLEEKKPKTAAVIGGGFIGLEMAENLHKAGVQVTIIELQNQVMAPLDYEMAELLHESIERNGVQLVLGDGVYSFEEQKNATRITLKSGKTIDTELVLLSIGVRPNSSLAEAAGLALNERGGIQVDSHLKTSKDHIYAVGDVIEVEHFVLGTKTMIPLAGPANKQARICADNLAGDEKEYHGTLGTSVAQVFDYTAASVGANEKILKAIGMKKGTDYETVLIHQKSHAGYYPGAVLLTLKILFAQDGKIYGAQIVGEDGVDKRIDVIASVMRLKGSIYDLEELELAYAPPYSSAKDPVNMLGFVAENILKGMASFISGYEVDALLEGKEFCQMDRTWRKENVTILDVTEDVERMVYHIPDSHHIPLGQLRSRLDELNREHLVIPYCAIGVRAYQAARILLQNGFSHVRIMEGGISFYKLVHFRDFIQNESVIDKERDDFIEQGDLLKACQPDKSIKMIDCSGLQCPGPIMKVHESITAMKDGEVLTVSSTDMGFSKDISSWCRQTGNTLLELKKSGKSSIVKIKKGTESALEGQRESSLGPKGKTMVIFSGDMDRVLASFIIANGAAAMGRPVTMFFTFWGLNVLRKPRKQPVKKSMTEKMFGAMMPRGSRKLKLSKMNMGGMGTAMMKKVMQAKHVDSLEHLMQQAMKHGVKLVACTMSMDVMGIKREEMIDGIEFAGVAAYLGDAENSDVNLFI